MSKRYGLFMEYLKSILMIQGFYRKHKRLYSFARYKRIAHENNEIGKRLERKRRNYNSLSPHKKKREKWI